MHLLGYSPFLANASTKYPGLSAAHGQNKNNLSSSALPVGEHLEKANIISYQTYSSKS